MFGFLFMQYLGSGGALVLFHFFFLCPFLSVSLSLKVKKIFLKNEIPLCRFLFIYILYIFCCCCCYLFEAFVMEIDLHVGPPTWAREKISPFLPKGRSAKTKSLTPPPNATSLEKNGRNRRKGPNFN